MDLTDIHAYFDHREAELVAAVSRLVAIPSTKGDAQPGAPFGPGPARALTEALQLAREWGLTGENLEGYVGTVDLNGHETQLHILAHLDVVPPGSGWTVTEPYAPKLVDGLLYGRGTDDDKGPLVAALFAMRAVKELGVPLSRNVRLIMGTDEESGFADIDWYYARHPFAPCTFSPDAGFPVTNLEKGHYQPTFAMTWPLETALPRVTALSGGSRVNVVPPEAAATVAGLPLSELASHCREAETACGVTFTLLDQGNGVEVTCHGTGAHASAPQEGNNALTALITLVSSLPLADTPGTRALHALRALFPHGDNYGKALGIAQSDSLSGDLTLALTMLSWSDTGMGGHFDCRTPLCATEANCRLAAEAALQRRGITLSGTITPAHHVPADSPFIQTLMDCYEAFTGKKGACLATGGGTYVHEIPGGVAFGASMPGFDSGLHGPDEKVRVADLLTACKIFTQAIIDLCS